MIDLKSTIQFVYGAVRANEAAGALNRMPGYEGYRPTEELQENYTDAERLSRDPFSPLSDERFEDDAADFSSLAYDRVTASDPSMAGVARAAANNQIIRNRNRRAQGGTRLMAQYSSIAADLAAEYQDLGDMNIEVTNERKHRTEVEAGKALRDANQQAVQGAMQQSEISIKGMDFINNLGSGGGGEADPDASPDKMPDDMDSDMAWSSFGSGGGGGFGF